MYKIGDFVINTNNGICEIKDIVSMNFSGSDKDYYLLIPVEEKTAKVYIENEKEREKTYKEALASREPKQLISIIKTLYLRRQKRVDEGKKVTAVDERYFKLAETKLHSELAFVLKVEKRDVYQIIVDNVTI